MSFILELESNPFHFRREITTKNFDNEEEPKRNTNKVKHRNDKQRLKIANVQVTNKKRQEVQESQSSSMGEVVDEELPEETLLEVEEEEEKQGLEGAVLALDLAGEGSSRSETEQEVVFPQPRKERRR